MPWRGDGHCRRGGGEAVLPGCNGTLGGGLVNGLQVEVLPGFLQAAGEGLEDAGREIGGRGVGGDHGAALGGSSSMWITVASGWSERRGARAGRGGG